MQQQQQMASCFAASIYLFIVVDLYGIICQSEQLFWYTSVFLL